MSDSPPIAHSSGTGPEAALWRAWFLPLLAVWAGILAAAAELVALVVRRHTGHPILFVGRDVWWTVMLVDVVLFLSLAAGLLLCRLLAPRVAWWRVALWLFVLLAVFGVLYNYPELYRLAALVLAAGAATQVVRWASRRPGAMNRLVRRTTPWLVGAAVAVLLAVRGSAWWSERRMLADLPPAGAKTNVLLIVLDTVRSLDLSLYGYRLETTPQLERWAARGVRFQQAFSTASWTLPSHASILTGRWSQDLAASWTTPLGNRYPTLAEVLRRRGYATAGFVANTDYTSREVGLGRGFAHYDDYSLTPGLILRSAALGRALERNRLLRPLVIRYHLTGRKAAPAISGALLDWLDRHPGRPWFAFLNYYDAHHPYRPPDPWRRRFARPGVEPAPRVRQQEDPKHPWTADSVRAFVAAYDGAIAYLDDQVGRLLTELDRRGELRHTLVIITADHGEEFGGHRLFDHGNTLYLPSIAVPLVLRLPGVVPEGVTVPRPVSLRDIPATVMDLLGLPGDGGFPGRSLARFWRHPDAAPDTVVAAIRRVPRQPAWFPASRGDMLSLVTDTLQYIRNFGDGVEELYNLARDAGEQRNLIQTPAGRLEAERFRTLTRQVLRQADDFPERGGRGTAGFGDSGSK